MTGIPGANKPWAGGISTVSVGGVKSLGSLGAVALSSATPQNEHSTLPSDGSSW